MANSMPPPAPSGTPTPYYSDASTTDTAMGVLRGCDCDICKSGDDQWCCRRCHDIARGGV